jgi:hypothetical protein
MYEEKIVKLEDAYENSVISEFLQALGAEFPIRRKSGDIEMWRLCSKDMFSDSFLKCINGNWSIPVRNCDDMTDGLCKMVVISEFLMDDIRAAFTGGLVPSPHCIRNAIDATANLYKDSWLLQKSLGTNAAQIPDIQGMELVSVNGELCMAFPCPPVTNEMLMEQQSKVQEDDLPQSLA